MDSRPRNNQRDGRARLRVPNRTGTKPSPTQPSRATIPLLDEEKRKITTPVVFRVFGWLWRTARKYPKRALAVVALLLIVGYTGLTSVQKSSIATEGKPTQVSGGSVTKLVRNETPKFKTVLPAGKSIEDYGGWARVSPPNRTPVYAYADKIGSVTINVSQQELPENLRDNSGEALEKLSADFDADKKLTAGNAVAYIGTSAKGPQSVILTKGDLLILMKSTAKVDDQKWIDYINSLR